MPEKPVIIFDFGDVLVEWKFQNLYCKVFNNDAEIELFLEKTGLREMNRCMDAGYPFAKGIAELSAAHPEYARELGWFNTRWGEARGPQNTQAIDLMRRLKEQGYRLYGLSNWSREKFDTVKDELLFLPLLQEYIISGDAGVTKPDERIYRMLLKRIGRPAGECIFIDDSEENVFAAEELGIRTILYRSVEQLRRELANMGIQWHRVSSRIGGDDMKYEEVSGIRVPKIGFGTWSIGGKSGADPAGDSKSLAALRSALELGYSHFDTAEIYASGHAEELLGEAVRASGKNRADLLITSKVSPGHLRPEAVLKACAQSLKRLKMEYLDIYLIHWPNPLIRLEETFAALNQLVRAGKVKHVGVSNFNLKLLRRAQELCETPILTDQVPYRLPDRTYAENGVLAYCQQNDILLTAYSPVKFRSIKVNSALKKIANDHSASTFQIALAWLIAQPRVISIPMSFNPAHQKENLQAVEIELSSDEMAQLNNLYSR